MESIEVITDESNVSVYKKDITAFVEQKHIDTATISGSDNTVSVIKKEYKLVGDDVYIGKTYEDAPQWIRDFINNVVDFSIGQKITELNSVTTSLNSLIEELNIAKNAYSNSIISSADIDERINMAIETLNSSIAQSNANIVNLISTKATPDEAIALSANVLQTSINNGEINSLVTNLQNSISNNTESLGNNIDTVYAEMNGEFENIAGEFKGTAGAINTLEAYVGVTNGTPNGTGALADIEILQKQNDGIIETVTGTYDVMLNPQDPNLAELVVTAEPYASWKAQDVSGIDTRLSHIGDVYIKYNTTSNGARGYVASYKFIRTIVDYSDIHHSTDADGFTWALIIDQAAQDAYKQALNAYDLADDKRRVFVGLGATSTPSVPYDQGDLWLIDAARTVNGYECNVGDILRCIESKGNVATYEQNDWVLASSYANAVAAEAAALETWKNTTYASTIATIQTQVDGKAETFYQSSIPTGRIKSINVPTNSTLDKYVGDLWKNTYAGTISGYLGNNTEYIYTKTANGSNWNYDWTKMEVPDIVFDTIDTKKSIYSGDNVPVAIAPDVIEINDMWITGANVVGYDKESIYVWNGTAWIKPLKYTDDTATVALRTGLGNGTVIVNLANATIDGSKALTTYVAEEIDKEVVVYSGTNHATQTGMKTNDIYIEKTTAAGSSGVLIDVVNTWKYNGTAWVQIGNNSNLTALADLTDGKRTIYSGSSLPVNSTLNPLKPNDLFIPTSTFTANTVIYTANEMYRYTGTFWDKATRYDEIKLLLSEQIDSKIETTYGGATPPYANQTNVPKNSRGGDYWYCDTDGSYLKGNIYKYLETTNGSNFNYTWTLSSDVSKGAFDLADKKRIIFGNAGNSVPTLAQGLALSDLWIPSSNGSTYLAGKVYKCTSITPITFVEVDYTNDEVVNGIINGTTPLDPNTITIGNTSTTFLEYLTAEIDNKIGVYSGETAPVAGQPSGVAANDIYLWFTTASKVLANGTTQVYDITRTYKYSGSVWNEITTDSNIVALADLADGKRTVFSGATVPVGAVERDIWIPSANNASYIKGEVYQYIGSAWVVATKYTADLEAVRTNLQGQLDGKVETYYQATVPTGITALNNGDYWYCTADVSTYKKGKVYKYTHATTSWVETADVSRYAFEVADGKAAIFSSANPPTSGYNINDMLIVVGSFNNGTTTFADGVVLSSNADRTSGFTPADWVKKINDTEDLDAFVSGTYTPAVASLQSQIDGQISYYFFDSGLGKSAASVSGSSSWTTDALKKEHNGDIAYDTKLELGYWYDRSVSNWVQITGAQNAGVIEALKKAAEAKGAADDVIVSYYAWKQTTAPATQYKWMKDDNTLWEYVGSTWVVVDVKKDDTLTAYNNTTKDTTLYVHNGSVWTMITPNGIVANAKAVTDLNASLSSLGTTVSGHTSLLNTVDTRIGAEGARVETKFAYNSTVNIGGIYKKSGFGLTTNYTSGSGTLADPYVSEFWIDASRFKFTNSNVTGSVAPFTIDATGTTPKITFNGIVNFTNTNISNGYPGTTKINGGVIENETITTNQIQASSISADRLSPSSGATTVWEGGGLVSANFNGNANGNIGTPTAGFRLSSNAAGTTTDPNIYGAYIKGAVVDGSFMKYSNNSLFLTAYDTLAPYAIFSSVNGYGGGLFYFDRLYSPLPGGSDIYRLSKLNQKVTVFGGFAGDYDVIYAAIQYKYNNDETWYTTFTRSIYADYRAGVAFSSSFTLKDTPYSYVDVRIYVYGYAPEASSATLQVSNI